MITTLDYSMDYINVGYTSRITFVFNLETGLGPGNYLSLLLPFTLETSVGPFVGPLTGIKVKTTTLILPR